MTIRFCSCALPGLACEHRRISGCRFSPPKEKNNSRKYVCVHRLYQVLDSYKFMYLFIFKHKQAKTNDNIPMFQSRHFAIVIYFASLFFSKPLVIRNYLCIIYFLFIYLLYLFICRHYFLAEIPGLESFIFNYLFVYLFIYLHIGLFINLQALFCSPCTRNSWSGVFSWACYAQSRLSAS